MVIVMDNLYFVAFIVICGALLIAIGLKVERKHRLKAQTRRKHAQQRAQLHQRHEVGGYHHIHGHARDERGSHAEVWDARHRRARDEDKPGSTIAATRVFADEEAQDDNAASGLKMTTIDYTPEELSKVSTPRR